MEDSWRWGGAAPLVEELVARSLGGRDRRILREALRTVESDFGVSADDSWDPALLHALSEAVAKVVDVKGATALLGKTQPLVSKVINHSEFTRPRAALKLVFLLAGSPSADLGIHTGMGKVSYPIGKLVRSSVGAPATHLLKEDPSRLDLLPPSDSLQKKRAGSNFAYDSEQQLVRAVLYALQGIDGHLIKLNEGNQSFTVASLKSLSPEKRKMVLILCELGWLYRHVAQYVKNTVRDESRGLVSQSFCGALQAELTEYFRLIAILENEESNLTLRQLKVWSQEPLRRLRLMAEMVDSVQGLRGGALASVVHLHSRHGDPFVSSFVDSIMRKVSAPIFESIRLWAMHGELSDACNEFFISADLSVPDERLWFDKYKLTSTMIPGFIGKHLARKILQIGKSINFIRYCCAGSLEDHHEAAVSIGEDFRRLDESLNENLADRASVQLLQTIDLAADATNARLRRILFDEFDLMWHLRVLKQYLMLGQGDTMQYLMDLLSKDLSSNKIMKHNLTANLETAIRASNTASDADEILQRLECILLQGDAGTSGWDRFVMNYRLTPPLSCVITEEAMEKYQQIFQHLWKINRVEHALSSAWKNEMSATRYARALTGIQHVLHQFHIVRTEMVHFVSNLHSYIMFEVLETSWAALVKNLEGAADLDEIVEAHELYLETITRKAMIESTVLNAENLDSAISPLTPLEPENSLESQPNPDLHAMLEDILSLCLRFAEIQKNLYADASALAMKKKRKELYAIERTQSGTWGRDEESMTSLSEMRKKDVWTERQIQDEEGRIIETYMEKISNLRQIYQLSIGEVLAVLKPTSSENLKFLCFRLDFNQYYEGSSNK